MTDFAALRQRMVDRDLAGRGIRDPLVLEAMREVPREAFVPPDLHDFAYEDSPLPIGAGQTISQPYIVARMIQSLALGAGERVLDIHNVGQLAREHFGDDAVLVGFGTDHGTVAAASEWGGEMEIKDVRPAHRDSYERLFHQAGIEAGLLHLRDPARDEVREVLEPGRLERAIGVVYRPETELQSHYFQASLPRQFDEYVWIDGTRAVRPLAVPELEGVPETYPFGL